MDDQLQTRLPPAGGVPPAQASPPPPLPPAIVEPTPEEGPTIRNDPGLHELAQQWIASRREERKRIATLAVNEIVAIGHAGDVALLTRIGNDLRDLVLEGTLQQQLCCKLAIELTGKRPVPLPDPLTVHVLLPLITALKVVVRVGAPTTRDNAIEGLGALLRLVHQNVVDGYGANEVPKAPEEGDLLFDSQYVLRLERRRRLVLAVAGHDESLKYVRTILGQDSLPQLEVLRAREQALMQVVDRLQKRAPKDDAATEELRRLGNHRERLIEERERLLYERADSLRVLPAIARQEGDLEWAIDSLRAAAAVLDIGDEREPRVLIAFARYHESLFRTIDVVLRRDAALCPRFDDVLAASVDAIPRTLVGDAPVCNARIRATIALIRTAVCLVLRSSGPAETKRAVRPLFDDLAAAARWANPGIAEGCYRALPQLALSTAHRDLAKTALQALLFDLERKGEDFVSLHRRLIAAFAFRAILLRLAENGDEERVRALLRRPQDLLRAVATAPRSTELSAGVIERVAFEKELFARTSTMLQEWDKLCDAEQVLLTRIVAVQLHKVARQWRDLAAFPILERVFISMPTLALADDDSRAIVFNLLSALPAGAAAAADADLHRFIERCGRMRGSERPDAHSGDLPDYVLAMISSNVSGRVADAVAREVDLSLRQERNRKKDERVDFARTLYQVMLRGPHERIFQHLLPRLEDEDDIRVADFFCRHVQAVRLICETQKDEDKLLDDLVPHVHKTATEIAHTPNPTLQRLRNALWQYESLAKNDSSLWLTIWRGDAGGGLGLLFRRLDTLAQFTHSRNLSAGSNEPARMTHRKLLEPIYRDRLVRVQKGVGQYLKLSIHEFDARRAALTAARDAVAEIETALAVEPALNPPERVLLTALLRRLRDIFHRTIAWYCDEPQRLMEANEPEDKNTFWLVFTSDPATWTEQTEEMERHLAELDWSEAVGTYPARLRRLMGEFPLADQIRRLRAARGMEPPPVKEQEDRFEESYVEWVSNDLDIDAIRDTVAKRSIWLRMVYAVITNLFYASLLIVVPCGWAIFMDRLELHWLEGAGFFVVAVAVSCAAAIAFSVILRKIFLRCRDAVDWIRVHWLKKKEKIRKRHFWFQATLPRMARLIAAPMVLIAELQHSYEFPLDSSSWVLLLLMILSFFTTRFFVSREVDPHTHTAGLSRANRTRVRQIVAVALSHAYAIALLFSMFFVTTHLRSQHETPSRQRPRPATRPAPESKSLPMQLLVDTLHQFDDVGGTPHHHPRFLGVLPRDVEFNIGDIASHAGVELPQTVVAHSHFRFYPTIILTWTAMGLFFGVFLEGFLSGKRLRTSRETASEPVLET